MAEKDLPAPKPWSLTEDDYREAKELGFDIRPFAFENAVTREGYRQVTDEDKKVSWGDYGRAAATGAAGIGESAAALTEWATSGRLGGDTRKFFSEISEEQFSRMGPRARRAMSAEFFADEGKQSIFDDFTASLGLKTVAALPSTAASIIPAGLAVRALSAAGTATRVATAGAVSRGTNSVLTGGEVAQQIYSTIDKMSDADLQKASDLYAGYRSVMSEKDARARYMPEVASAAPFVGMVIGALTPGVETTLAKRLGGEAAKGVAKGTARGATTESVQEFVEGVTGEALSQVALVEAKLKSGMDWEKVLGQGLEGALVGVGMGAGGGALGGIGARRNNGVNIVPPGAPDPAQQAALGATMPQPPAQQQQTPPAAPVAPPAAGEVTGEVTVPETLDSLQDQQEKLVAGDIPAMLFPWTQKPARGVEGRTQELALPDGFDRVTTREGIIHFDPKVYKRQAIITAVDNGRINDILGYVQSKPEVAAAAAAGDGPPRAVVERGPNGEERGAALVSPSQERAQVEMFRRRQSPDSTIVREPPEQTLQQRMENAPPFVRSEPRPVSPEQEYWDAFDDYRAEQTTQGPVEASPENVAYDVEQPGVQLSSEQNGKLWFINENRAADEKMSPEEFLVSGEQEYQRLTAVPAAPPKAAKAVATAKAKEKKAKAPKQPKPPKVAKAVEAAAPASTPAPDAGPLFTAPVKQTPAPKPPKVEKAVAAAKPTPASETAQYTPEQQRKLAAAERAANEVKVKRDSDGFREIAYPGGTITVESPQSYGNSKKRTAPGFRPTGGEMTAFFGRDTGYQGTRRGAAYIDEIGSKGNVPLELHQVFRDIFDGKLSSTQEIVVEIRRARMNQLLEENGNAKPAPTSEKPPAAPAPKPPKVEKAVAVAKKETTPAPDTGSLFAAPAKQTLPAAPAKPAIGRVELSTLLKNRKEERESRGKNRTLEEKEALQKQDDFGKEAAKREPAQDEFYADPKEDDLLRGTRAQPSQFIRSKGQRKALEKRLQKVLDDAKAAGVNIDDRTEKNPTGLQGKIFAETPDGVMYLRVAKDMLKLLKQNRTSPEATQALNDFIVEEQLARKGDFSAMRSRRQVEGDMRNRRSGGDIEAVGPKADAPDKIIEANEAAFRKELAMQEIDRLLDGMVRGDIKQITEDDIKRIREIAGKEADNVDLSKIREALAPPAGEKPAVFKRKKEVTAEGKPAEKPTGKTLKSGELNISEEELARIADEANKAAARSSLTDAEARRDREMGKTLSADEWLKANDPNYEPLSMAGDLDASLPSHFLVVHGGSDFDAVDLNMSGFGEPGGIRPLDKGLYGFLIDPRSSKEEIRSAIETAQHYAQKYGRGKKTVHLFRIPNTTTTSWNGPVSINFPRGRTQEEAAYFNALVEADKLPVGSPERKAAFEEAWALGAVAEANPSKPQMRAEKLPGGLIEVSILDPAALERVGKFPADVPANVISTRALGGPLSMAGDANAAPAASFTPKASELLRKSKRLSPVQRAALEEELTKRAVRDSAYEQWNADYWQEDDTVNERRIFRGFGETYVRTVSRDKDGKAVLSPPARVLETRTLSDVMQNLVRDDVADGPLFDITQQILERNSRNTPVHFISDEDMKVVQSGALAFFDPVAGHIVMPDRFRLWSGMASPDVADFFGVEAAKAEQWVFNHTVLHEGTHAALRNQLARDPIAVGQLRAISQELLAAMRKTDPNYGKKYMFKNSQEFLAEALSNGARQREMRGVTITRGLAKALGLPVDQNISLWRAFVLKAADWLGLGDRFKSNIDALDAVLSVVQRIENGGLAPTSFPVLPPGWSKYFAPRGSLSTDIENLSDEWFLKTLPDALGPDLLPTSRDDLTDRGNAFKSWMGRVVVKGSTLDQMRQLYRGLFKDSNGDALERVIEGIQRIAPYAAKKRERAEQLAQRFIDYSRNNPKEAAELSDIAIDATMSNVQLGPNANNKHLDQNWRGWQGRKHLADLQKRYAAMSDEGRALYNDMATFYRDMQNEMTEGLVNNILDEIGVNPPNRQAFVQRVMDGKMTAADETLLADKPTALKALKEAREVRAVKGDYFPLMRNGDYVVVTEDNIKDLMGGAEIEPGKVEFRGASRKAAMDAAKAFAEASPMRVINLQQSPDTATSTDFGVIVTVQKKGVFFFESETEANKWRRENADNFDSVSQVQDRLATARTSADLTTAQFNSLMGSIERQTDDPTIKETMKGIMEQAAARMMSGNRIQQRSIARRNVQGASKDFGRNLIQYGQAAGGYLAKIKYMPTVREGLKSMTKLATEGMSTDAPQRVRVLNEIRLRIDQGVIEPTDPPKWLSDLMTLTYLGKLFSPMYSVINGMQPWMVTYPVLAGRYGAMRASAALAGAYRSLGFSDAVAGGLRNTYLAGKQITSAGLLDTSDISGSIKKKVSGEPDGAELVKVIDMALERGAMSAGGFELAQALAEGRGAWGTGLSKVDRIARQLPQAVEDVNRAVTLIAAYRLARGANMSEEKAASFAFDTVMNTQGDYSAANAPRFFSNPYLRPALQFKKYAQMVTFLLADMVHKSFKGASVEERRAAQKALVSVLGVQIAMAGTLSLPGLEIAKLGFMFAAFFGFGGGWDDQEEKLRKLADDAFGKTWGELISRGVLTRALNIDVSQRLSLADMWTFGEPKKYDKDNLNAYLAQLLFGAPGSTGADFFNGLREAGKATTWGDVFKAGGQMLPIKFVSDAFKAANNYSEGKATAIEVGMNVFGVRSGRQAEKGREIATKIRERDDLQKRYKELSDRYLKARNSGERAMIRARIVEHNKTAPLRYKVFPGALDKVRERIDAERVN